MMLRDAQRNNGLISGALFAALAVSMIIISGLFHATVFIVRSGVRAIAQKGHSK